MDEVRNTEQTEELTEGQTKQDSKKPEPKKQDPKKVYIHVTKEEVKNLLEGKELELVLGKKIVRTLTTKTAYDLKKAEIDAKYQAELKKLESK